MTDKVAPPDGARPLDLQNAAESGSTAKISYYLGRRDSSMQPPLTHFEACRVGKQARLLGWN